MYLRISVVLLVLTYFVSPLYASPVSLYGIDPAGKLYNLRYTSGAGDNVASLIFNLFSQVGPGGFEGLTYHDGDKCFYTTVNQNPGTSLPKLIKYDIETKQASIVGIMSTVYRVSGVQVLNGELFVIHKASFTSQVDFISTIDRNNASVLSTKQIVFLDTVENASSLTISPLSGQLSVFSSPGRFFFDIDTISGSISPLCSGGVPCRRSCSTAYYCDWNTERYRNKTVYNISHHPSEGDVYTLMSESSPSYTMRLYKITVNSNHELNFIDRGIFPDIDVVGNWSTTFAPKLDKSSYYNIAGTLAVF